MRCGPYALTHAEQPIFGIRRRLELFVREDLGVRRVVDGFELQLVEVGHLAQFFGDTDLINAVSLAERAAGNRDIFIVIDLKPGTISGGRNLWTV